MALQGFSNEKTTEILKQLNQYVNDRCLRSYQAQIAKTGEFSFSKSLGKENEKPLASFLFQSGEIAYKVVSEPEIWLLAAGTSRGYPLVQLYNRTLKTILWTIDNESAEKWASYWRLMDHHLDSNSVERLPKLNKVRILTGHNNFAHLIWNELPALYWLATEPEFTRSCQNVIVHASHEPIFSLAHFLENTHLRGKVTGHFSNENVPILSEDVIMRVGSQHMAKPYREHLINVISRDADTCRCREVEKRLLANRPTVWIACRIDSRTAINQKEFLVTLVNKMIVRHGPLNLLFDGFSYPKDINSPSYNGFREGLEERALEIGEYIDGLIRSIDQPSAAINVSGMDLCDAIYVGRHAQYYIAPAGTIQHKIAWIYNIHGSIHSNQASISGPALKWLGNQLEGGKTPGSIPKDLIEDLISSRKSMKINRNVDYRILDIPSASDHVLSDMEHCLLGS